MYDSREDTLKHIARVGFLLDSLVLEISARKLLHDISKLKEPEKPLFDEYTPKLAVSTYGSEEYSILLTGMKEGIGHHYTNNRHHPEHFSNGINGMSLIDIVEMLCDWKAATERHNNGDIRKSIEINKDRFGISEQLTSILRNTVDAMKW